MWRDTASAYLRQGNREREACAKHRMRKAVGRHIGGAAARFGGGVHHRALGHHVQLFFQVAGSRGAVHAAAASTTGSGSRVGGSAGGSVAGGCSCGGSSTGGTGEGSSSAGLAPKIMSGRLPSINSGVSARPQPRERSPPKPLSANKRNAA